MGPCQPPGQKLLLAEARMLLWALQLLSHLGSEDLKQCALYMSTHQINLRGHQTWGGRSRSRHTIPGCLSWKAQRRYFILSS